MKRLQALGCFSLGVVVTSTAALLVGAARSDDAPVGRYQISNSDHFAFIIDTATGAVMRKKLYDTDVDWGLPPGGDNEFYGEKRTHSGK